MEGFVLIFDKHDVLHEVIPNTEKKNIYIYKTGEGEALRIK